MSPQDLQVPGADALGNLAAHGAQKPTIDAMQFDIAQGNAYRTEPNKAIRMGWLSLATPIPGGRRS